MLDVVWGMGVFLCHLCAFGVEASVYLVITDIFSVMGCRRLALRGFLKTSIFQLQRRKDLFFLHFTDPKYE